MDDKVQTRNSYCQMKWEEAYYYQAVQPPNWSKWTAKPTCQTSIHSQIFARITAIWRSWSSGIELSGWRNIPSHYSPRATLKHWFHLRHCFPRMFFPVFLLIELLSDDCPDNSSIKCTDVDCDQRSKWSSSPVWFNHVPKNCLFPFWVYIICIFPPQIRYHVHKIFTLPAQLQSSISLDREISRSSQQSAAAECCLTQNWF